MKFCLINGKVSMAERIDTCDECGAECAVNSVTVVRGPDYAIAKKFAEKKGEVSDGLSYDESTGQCLCENCE